MRIAARSVGLFAVVVVAVGAGLGSLVAAQGYPVRRVPLSADGAWLASDAGLLSLVDGSTGEVETSVRVPTGSLESVQRDEDGYAVDPARGTVTRVSGATFAASPATILIPGATGLQVFPSKDRLFGLDAARGEVVSADPATLTVAARESLSALSGGGIPDQGVVDAAGRLWLLDPGSGTLSHVDGSKVQVHPRAVPPGVRARLVLASGAPAVVDLSHGVVDEFDAGGDVVRRACITSPGANADGVSAAAEGGWVFAVGAGQLHVTGPGTGACGEPIDVAASGDSLGTAVESDGSAFVPDYTTGSVIVVDLARGHPVAAPQVLPTRSRFELIAAGGQVFYNSPAGDQAGVVKLDGSVLRVSKYDRSDPYRGVGFVRTPLSAAGGSGAPTPSSTTPSSATASASTAATAPPTRAGEPKTSPPVWVINSPGNPSASASSGPTPSRTTTLSRGPSRTPSASVPPRRRPTSPPATSSPPTSTPVGSTPTPPPSDTSAHDVTLTLQVTGSGARVTSDVGGISCSAGSGTCSGQVPVGTSVTLSVQLGTGASLASATWNAAGCSGADCVVTPTTDMTVAVRLSIEFSLGLTAVEDNCGPCTVQMTYLLSHDTCADQCSRTIPAGVQVTLSVDDGNPNTADWYYFSTAWTGCPAVSPDQMTCTLTMDASATVGVTMKGADNFGPPPSP